MGYIWFGIILIAFVVAAATGTMNAVTSQALESAKDSVTLAINLVGSMALFLGVMKVAEDAGLMRIIARLIRPVMVRLFPDVPADHPAMGAMIMNMSANVLGLANAATPLGINAMVELDKLNKRKSKIKISRNRINLTMAGGVGGNKFEQICPPGTIAVGIRGGAGIYIDNLQVVCAPLE